MNKNWKLNKFIVKPTTKYNIYPVVRNYFSLGSVAGSIKCNNYCVSRGKNPLTIRFNFFVGVQFLSYRITMYELCLITILLRYAVENDSIECFYWNPTARTNARFVPYVRVGSTREKNFREIKINTCQCIFGVQSSENECRRGRVDERFDFVRWPSLAKLGFPYYTTPYEQ